ncbi:putative non-ribosomal peptide synthetase SirP [Zalerion maritima]|uniref:Non-ribosomal peptide synthetase SirP n=1 Tax=Zalerion maritima TaxID=339359 RepID=A0AAD5RRJ1_9PEZI|nr:putative non-ribosomal peptide synthetase SirP [Zalerion maritima]
MSTNPISVFDLVCARVEDQPYAIAVSEGEKCLSYAALDAASRRIAYHLRSRNVRAGDVVPILTSRCLEMVACVLAVVRVGACWVPMEAGTWSRDRIDAVLGAVAPKAVLVTDNGRDWGIERAVPVQDIRDALFIEAAADGVGKDNGDDFSHYPVAEGPENPQDMAYVIFTSGTTGSPKGVSIAHRSLLNYVQEGGRDTPFNLTACSSDIVLLLFSVAFDAYYGVLFSALCNGAHVKLSESSTFLDDARACTILPTTPTLLGALPDPEAYKNLRAIFLGGESPSPELVKKWWSPTRALYNAYGPSEATIAASIAELTPGAPITLGKPIRHSRIILLDSELRECSEGEICITGQALAIGYYHDAERTAEKFIQWQEQRVYRTGDLARRNKTGDLVFLGRRDQLVKNRGFLVNIEAEVLPALLTQSGVEFAAAFMHRQRLVAFVAPEVGQRDARDLRRDMAERCDSFLVPDEVIYLALDQLPMTPNGKVDTRALQTRLDNRKQAGDQLPSSDKTSRMGVLKAAIGNVLDIPATLVHMESSFSQLGGNSVLAIKLLSYLRQSGFGVPFAQLFLLPTLAAVADSLEQHSPHEAAGDGTPAAQARKACMTPAQIGMVTSTIRDPPAGYMLVSISLNMLAADIERLRVRDAWQTVLTRHDLFQAAFDAVDGVLEVDVHGDPHDQHFAEWKQKWPLKAEEVQQVISEESAALLDLAQGQAPDDNNQGRLFRPAKAFRLVTSPNASHDSVLLWLVHHSQVDGWSVGTIVNEVRSLISGKGTKQLQKPSLLPPFSSYTNALPSYVERTYERAEGFWSDAMAGLLGGTDLNLARPELPHCAASARDHSTGFDETSLRLGISLPQAEISARVSGGSLAVVIYAAWALLLSGYSSKDEVVFGTVLSGRNFPVPGVEQIVGPLINTCPFPIRLHELYKKSDLLGRVRDLLLEISEYQWSASQYLSRAASGSLSNIFTTMVTLEYDLPGFANQCVDGDLAPWTFRRTDVPEFGLTVQVQTGVDGELILRALFDKSLYRQAAVCRMLSHYRNLCLALVDSRVHTVDDVRRRMLEPSEFVLLTQNSPSFLAPYSGPTSLKEAFELGVDQWPDMIAVEWQSRTLTYSELDRMANHVAKSMAGWVPPRSVVALLGDGSRNWLIGAIAIIKAGAVYLPLDTQLPIQRMQTMVQRAGAALCVYPNQKCLDRFTAVLPQKLLLHELLPETEPSLGKDLVERLPTTTRPQDYAYVMFTSGSTGTPKGIRVTHHATLSHLAYEPARLHARPGRRHAHMFSPGFDVSIAEVFGALCFGATLVLKDMDDPFAHLARVHATMITPSFLSVCSPDELTNLDTIYLIGEAVPQSLSDRWSDRKLVYNAYGPCECTIACLFARLEPGKPVTLGRTIPRVGAYVLDPCGRPAPIGVAGEIYLSGIQVADGYLGADMESVTRRVFLPDPFKPGHAMYRTGDLGAWTDSLELRYLGRVDDDSQVKVRGYRVELQEVENAILRASSAVAQAAVVVNKEKDRIFAFVAPETVDTTRVLEAARLHLPPYACPSAIVALNRLPTTPNQKLDKKVLVTMTERDMGTTRNTSATVAAANNGAATEAAVKITNTTELLLQRVWKETIGLADNFEVGREDDFLALGGNSLRQINAAQKICASLGLRIPVYIFIRNTRMDALAEVLDDYCVRHRRREQLLVETPASESFLQCWPSLRTSPQAKFTELSYLEKELYVMHQRSMTPSTFNVAHEVFLQGPVDLDVLEHAIKRVVQENSILRTCFEESPSDGQIRRTERRDEFRVLRCKGPARNVVDGCIHEPFDLARDQLTRIALIEDDEGREEGREQGRRLVFVQHHIITDQVSIQLFFQKLGEFMSQLTVDGNGKGVGQDMSPQDGLPQYAAWAHWNAAQMRRGGHSGASESPQAKYWKTLLADVPPSPFSQTRRNDLVARTSQNSSDDAGLCSFQAIRSPTSCGSLELYVTAVSVAFLRVLGTTDLVIGIPYIDRTEPGTGEMLGLFLDRLPVRLGAGQEQKQQAEREGVARLIASARAAIQGALEHALPYQTIRDVVGSQDSRGLFDVMVVYNRREDCVTRNLSLPRVSVSSNSRRARGSKFPVLIELTENEKGTTCEIEYSLDAVNAATVHCIRDEMLNVVGGAF